MKKLAKAVLPLADLLLAPFVYPAAWLLKIVRIAGVQNLRLCKRVLLQVGIFPIRNHYYEPQFDFPFPESECARDRNLPGIDWNITGQLKLLEEFRFAHELADLPQKKTDPLVFSLNTGAFDSGDAEYWYQLLRAVKPRRIIEIGSGHSTLMAINAIKQSKAEDPGYSCEHTCIEPYEMPWLEKSGVSVIRKKVEDVDLSFFGQLQENDILFIDSSHMIRPQGDVLFEYLELLPSLRKGVIVHIHDIFSPRNYSKQWIMDQVRFWNEQYLLEAFLSHNSSWEIMGAVNYLRHNHFEKLKTIAPYLSEKNQPGSFYIRKIA